ncbi:MAG: hypothetical protein IJ093_01955 [Bacilli bacterium]|nr:hypothetical protein [Bacilli bacterium]
MQELNAFLKEWQRTINRQPLTGGKRKEAFLSFKNRLYNNFRVEVMEGINLNRVKGQYLKINGHAVALKIFKKGTRAGKVSFYILP